MKSITIFIFMFAVSYSPNLNAQAVEAKSDNWTPSNSQVTYEKGAIHVTNISNKSAILWLNNINFKNGTIELDIKGKEVDGESFLGVAFHGLNNESYEAIYFRPFIFRNPERKSHSIQYINLPDYDWNVLRENHPGKYENAVQPVPDPNDWFHARIDIQSPLVKVYINDSKEPSLVVEQISRRQEGKIGLWLDSKDGWFKNVVISPSTKSR
jgi:hypothetical protein